MTAPRKEAIGNCELWLGDCLSLIDQFDPSWAVVTDPPYGMAWDPDTRRFSGSTDPGRHGAGKASPPVYGDTSPFDPTPWLAFPEVILWGMNHFAQRLPRGTTLVWLKRFDQSFGTFLSDAELAWHKGGHGVYCHRDLSLTAEALHRLHPCQKPVGLLAWCIARTTAPTILDPYMGVGSTALAALKCGRRFVGCEIDPRYFELACRRIEAAYKQPDLFLPHSPAPPPVQPALFVAARRMP